MPVQKRINNFQPIGMTGEQFSSFPKGATTYNLIGSNTVAAVAASGSIAFGANAAANDTINVNGKIFKFVSANPGEGEVVIGSAAADTASNFADAVNASSVQTGVVASVSGSTVTLTAETAGAIGNSYALTSSNSSITATAFSGGADVTNGTLPAIGLAYTMTSEEGVAKVGGTGKFAGIAFNPKEHIAATPLTPTLDLKANAQNGIYYATAALMKMGTLFLKVAGAVSYGGDVQFNQSTGAVSQPATAGTADSGCTLIKGAVWMSSTPAGDVAVLQLGGAM